MFSHDATVMLVALGVNDIGWGMKADAEHEDVSRWYSDSHRQMQGEDVRVIVCSPAITAENPETAEKGFLQRMADEGMAEANRLVPDTDRHPARACAKFSGRSWKFNAGEPDKAKHVTLHAADGVHLNDLGQLAMAFAILKGLGAPDHVSSMTIDAKNGKVSATAGCRVTKAEVLTMASRSRGTTMGLPLNRGIFRVSIFAGFRSRSAQPIRATGHQSAGR